MKRLGILFVGLLSLTLVFSVVGLATEWDSADASITFDDVLVLLVDGNYEFPNITQDDLENSTNIAGEGGGLVSSSTNPTVKVWTLTSDWSLGATYGDPNGTQERATGLFEIYGEELMAFYNVAGNYDPSTKDGKPGSTAVDITSYFGGGGSTHWPDPQEGTPSLSFDPAKLSGEVNAGEELTWRIDFWVYEGSIPTSNS